MNDTRHVSTHEKPIGEMISTDVTRDDQGSVCITEWRELAMALAAA